MKTRIWIALVVAGAVAIFAGGEAIAVEYHLDMNVADANGDYLWGESNNWTDSAYYGSGTIGGMPGTADGAYVGEWDWPVITGVLDGTAAQARKMNVAGGSTFEIRSGSLSLYDLQNVWRIGYNYGHGTVNMSGGTVNIVNSSYVHGSIVMGQYGGGTLNQSGGTINAVVVDSEGKKNCAILIGQNQDWDNNSYTISGGTVNTHGIKIGNANTSTTNTFTISGTATVNQVGDRYWSGLVVGNNSTMKIIGGNASINLTEDVVWGSWNNTGGTFTVGFELTSTGISTVNSDGITAREFDGITDTVGVTNILDLQATDGATGTYALFHTATDPTASLGWITTTGDANFSNLRVETDANGFFDVLVDYAGAATVIPGDANLDGYVDDDDLSLLLSSWGQVADWANGEFSGIDPVNDDDLSILLTNWHVGTPAAAGELVPEPATVGLLLAGGWMLIRRRKR